MIARILAIATSGFLQLWRTRIYLNLLVASVVLVGTALALDELAAGEGGRVLLDLGLAFIALMTSATAGVVAVVSITRDIETRQIHLFLARPISRAEFVLGRFTTVALLVLLTTTLLTSLLATIVFVVSDAPVLPVFTAGVFSSMEALIIAAIAILFGTGSSSSMSAVFTTTVFVLGRLTLALRELLDAGKLDNARGLFEGVYAVLPHFSAFDLSAWARGSAAVDAGEVFSAALYGVLYIAALLALAVWRLTRRDLL